MVLNSNVIVLLERAKMKSMKLSTKIIGGFLIGSLISIVIGYIGVSKINLIEKADSEMYELCTMPMGEMSDGLISFQLSRNRIKDIFIARFMMEKDPKEHVEAIKELDKKFNEALNLYEPTMRAAEVKKKFADAKATLEKYYPVRDQIIRLAVEGKKQEAMDLLYVQGAPLAKQVEASLNELMDVKVEQAKIRAVNNLATASSAVIFTWIGAAIGTILSIVLGIYLALSITRPINRVVQGLSEASEQVAVASTQVSGASQHLASGASQQAASIEETSSSLEEMASMTKQNAEHANQANQLMIETTQVVSNANNSMGQLTASMIEISKASEETSKIIKTIDEIAFQTNLLALNAAVEAARAGEAGAGFAVVADEVRNLAMRAAEAAKNTADLIEGTVKRIKEGSEIVNQTSAEFYKVADSAQKMGGLVGEITAASVEQAQGIEQINKAVGEMDKVVQENAANAEESASASEEMNAQAEQMKIFVGELITIIGGSSDLSDGGSIPKRRTNANIHTGKELVAASQVKAPNIPLRDEEINIF